MKFRTVAPFASQTLNDAASKREVTTSWITVLTCVSGKPTPPPNDTPLKIEDVMLVFIFWAAGILMALGALMLEFIMPNNQWLAPGGPNGGLKHSNATSKEGC